MNCVSAHVEVVGRQSTVREVTCPCGPFVVNIDQSEKLGLSLHGSEM